jgi:hypothetical protein
VLLKSKLDTQQTHLRGRFVEHPSMDKVAQQSVTKFMAMTVINLVIPKGAAQQELLLNKLASNEVLLRKTHAERQLCVDKFIIVNDVIWVTLCCATYIRLRYSTNPCQL